MSKNPLYTFFRDNRAASSFLVKFPSSTLTFMRYLGYPVSKAKNQIPIGSIRFLSAFLGPRKGINQKINIKY